MHYAGHLVSDGWRDFAASRGLLLIEDAAHAAGVDGAGGFGDAAVFSFYGNKNMTTAEGGMVAARNAEVLDRIRQLRNHGMTSSTLQRRDGLASYDVPMLGYNYRMDELRAAIGLVQLGKLSGWNKKRTSLTRTYEIMLKEYCPEIGLTFDGSRLSAHHILPTILPKGADRQRIMAMLREAGIQTTIHYPPVHLLSLYRDQFPSVDLPLTEEFARRELTLPLHPKLEERHVEVVARGMAEALAAERAIL